MSRRCATRPRRRPRWWRRRTASKWPTAPSGGTPSGTRSCDRESRRRCWKPTIAMSTRDGSSPRSARAKRRKRRPRGASSAPAPADVLLGYYHEAEAASGVGWNYLAAINLIETCFGRIAGVSSAGAQGPMQFLPSTFARYGDGGDIPSPHDSIMAAGRFLAANGFADDHDHAIFGYNHSSHYVSAVERLCRGAGERSGGLRRLLPVGCVLLHGFWRRRAPARRVAAYGPLARLPFCGQYV